MKKLKRLTAIKYTKRLYCFKEDQYLQDKITEILGRSKREVLEAKYGYIIHRGIVSMVHMKKKYVTDGFPLRMKANQDAVKVNPELHIGTLSQLFGGADCANKRIIDNLIAWNIIYLFKDFIPGVSAKRYKFTPEWEAKDVMMRNFKGGAKSSIYKLINLEENKLKDPLVRATQNMYDNHVSLSDEGLQYIQHKYNHPVIHDIIQALKGDYFDDNKDRLMYELRYISYRKEDTIMLLNFLMQNTGCNEAKKGKRLFHSITSLKREYRKFILIDGKPIREVDLVNSQPTFSVGFLKGVYHHAAKQKNESTELPADFIDYEELCCNGRFYERIAEKAGMPFTDDTRADFKEDFFKYIFYSKVKVKDNPIKDAFVALFPNVYQVINGIKSINYKRFATILQDLEADLMVYSVYKQMLDENFKVLVLHDAILCSSEEAEERAKELIREQFLARYNQRIRFKGESMEKVPEIQNHTIDDSNLDPDELDRLINEMESSEDDDDLIAF